MGRRDAPEPDLTAATARRAPARSAAGPVAVARRRNPGGLHGSRVSGRRCCRRHGGGGWAAAAAELRATGLFHPVLHPRAYEVAYGVAPLLRRGIDGRGETVALPELAETPSHSGLSYTDIRPKITGGASGLVHLESFARLLVQLRRRHCADSAPSFSIASGHVTRVQNAIFCLPCPGVSRRISGSS